MIGRGIATGQAKQVMHFEDIIPVYCTAKSHTATPYARGPILFTVYAFSATPEKHTQCGKLIFDKMRRIYPFGRHKYTKKQEEEKKRKQNSGKFWQIMMTDVKF